MFGGVAFLEGDSDSPSTEFKIAIGGPIVTALIVLLCAGAGCCSPAPTSSEAALTTGDADTTGLAALIAWLGSINLLADLQPGPRLPWTAAR